MIATGCSQLSNSLDIKPRSELMDIYVCSVCGYEYDPEAGLPEKGIEPGTPFEELPEDWVCPVCGASKDAFRRLED